MDICGLPGDETSFFLGTFMLSQASYSDSCLQS